MPTIEELNAILVARQSSSISRACKSLEAFEKATGIKPIIDPIPITKEDLEAPGGNPCPE